MSKKKTTKVSLKRQQAIIDKFLVAIHGEEPFDIVMAASRFAFTALRAVTTPDENGNKLGRMRIIWAEVFDAIAMDEAMEEFAQMAGCIDWNEIHRTLEEMERIPKP